MRCIVGHDIDSIEQVRVYVDLATEHKVSYRQHYSSKSGMIQVRGNTNTQRHTRHVTREVSKEDLKERQ